MKKLFFFALALMPFAFLACDTEKEGEDVANATVLEGTWYYDDYHHPFTIVFKGDTYTFETTGFKDRGTFTYRDNVITCNLAERWSAERVEWENGKRVNKGEWENIGVDKDYKSRKFEVTLLENGVCIGNLTDDFYGGEPIEIMLICQGIKISVNASELNGEWIFKEGQMLTARLLVDGNKYTIWQRMPYSQDMACTKEKGEWSYADGYLNLTPDSLLFSYSHGNDGYTYSRIDPETLEAEEWYPAQYGLDEKKFPAYKSKDAFYISITDNEMIYKFNKK